MIEQIAAIINPVRVMKVEDWMKVANVLRVEKVKETNGLWSANSYSDYKNKKFIELLSRYESLTSQPLTKEMFVCDVDRPKEFDLYLHGLLNMQDAFSSEEYGKWLVECRTYQAAQSKLWFEGFEIDEDCEDCVNGGLSIHFQTLLTKRKRVVIWAAGKVILRVILRDENPTISDLITEISRYNRTESKPVEIKLSENFIREVVK